MKDGRTHLAHKAEHAVDLETGAVVAVVLAPADEGDTTTIGETVPQAGMNIAEAAHGVPRAGETSRRPSRSLRSNTIDSLRANRPLVHRG
jgi:hypothetical protein